MKLRTKSIITLVAMLLSGIGAFAADGTGGQQWTLTYLLDGEASTEANAGTVVGTISGSTATLTVTPAEGNYITKDQITVVRTIAGDYAHTRSAEISSPVEITATSQTADPSGKTTYTFDASDPNFNYEVTANFQRRIDVAGAQILLPEDAVFEYKGGEAIEPEISVTYNGVDLTADKEYTVSYSNNNNAGQGVVTITGVGMYKGTLSEEFTIGKASVEIRFETAAGAEATELETTFGTTFTEPVLKLNPAGAIEVTYSVNDESVATINPSTGKLTILKPGTVVVTAAAKENYTNKEGSNYEADPTSTQASYSLTINKATPTLAFSKETATATMGQAFTAPTLNNPNSLAVTYSSSKETVATISEEGVVTIVGEGETTIKAKFAGNDKYEPAEASYTLTVSKDKATLAYSTQTATATMGQAFTAPTLSNPNNLAVTYSSSKETVATISEEGVVTIVGEGETTIKATFAGNDTYEFAEASYTLTVSKDKATLAYSTQTATATMGQAFTAPTLSNPNNLAVTYSSSKETVATISEEGVVTLVGEGETTIKATFAGNDTYEAAEASYTLTVSKDKATLAYSTQTATATMGQAFTAPTLSNPNSLAVTYSSSKETVATISEEGVVTIVGEGETTIKATFAGNDTYEFAEASYTLTVSKDKATLAYSTQTATATMGQAFTAPTLNNPNSLAVTYSSSKETVATISEEGVVTIVGEGETTITAKFAGNDKYEPAEASYKLTVSKATMEVTATGYEGVYDGNAHGITVTAPEGATVKYGTEEGKYDLTENPTYTNVGTYTVYYQVTKEGTETVTGSAKVTINKVTATLTFSAETATATLGSTTFQAPTLTVTPGGLSIKYESTNTDVATVNETTGAVTLIGAGETTITAKFAGNDKYEPAEASYKLTVSSKATMEVTATGYEGVYDGNAHGITVTAPEGATVKYGTEEGKYDLTENPTYTNVGTYTVYYQVTKEGTETVTGSAKVTINKVTATLTFSAETATTTVGSTTFQAPTLTVTPGGLSIKYESTNTDVATVNETTGAVTLIGAGETTIKATFAGNDKYEPAEASYKLTVSSKATMEVTATGYEGVYDGNAHGITVTAPEGATVKYGTEEGKYDLTENPTYTNVGTYTVYYQVTKEATETVTGSAKITITKATATLTFSAETATATLGAEFQTPTLTVTPEGLEGVKYTSSNTDVATVNETTGAVTLVAAGETTITAKFAGNDNYEAAEASYTLTVNRAQSEGYGLWINDIQVTEDNYFDVLGNSTGSKSGTIVFNPETNTLVMTNDVSNVEIESRLESLTLHINDVNKVKSIRFNNLDDATKTGKLAITTNGNFPGQIIITNDKGKSAILGFSEITLNMGLQYLEPELVEIENGELYKYDWDNTNSDNPVKKPDTKAVCDAVTIGVVITPLTRNVTVSMANASDYTAKDENGNTVLDENGNPKTVSMMNFAQNKDILLTLWTKNDEDNYQKGNDGDWPDAGFDNSDGDPGITMVITMTDAQALAVAASVLANTIQPGGTTYSMEFKGATFIVPAGSGEIDVWVKTDPGYVYKLLPVGLSEETHKLDFNSPSIKEYEDLGNGKIKVTVEYNDLPTQTYYMLYLAEEAPSGARGGTRLGKRDKAHGKLYSVGVRPRSITDVNPPSEASGGVIDEEEDPEGVIDNPTPPTPPTGIQTVASESSVNSNKWFTADGRQLEGKPTKPGFYIRNGKKVVIK